jgi:hypothetical protein
MAMQGAAALPAGLLAQRLGGGHAGATTAIGIMGCTSLAITATLVPGLRRTRPHGSLGRNGEIPAIVSLSVAFGRLSPIVSVP